jgi:hypothetical protein
VTTPAQPAAQNVPAAEEVEVPQSPIDLWTILAGIAFVILIIGGVALYRSKLNNLVQPPTVTGTGLPPSEISVSAGAAPSHPAQEAVAAAASKPLVIEKPKEEEVQYVQLTVEQKLELEKFVFHALSQGFSEEAVAGSLIKKGWPKGNVDEIMQEVSPKR